MQLIFFILNEEMIRVFVNSASSTAGPVLKPTTLSMLQILNLLTFDVYLDINSKVPHLNVFLIIVRNEYIFVNYELKCIFSNYTFIAFANLNKFFNN